MALFTTEDQTSAYARDPTYYSGSKFMLGLMGYKANGQQNTFGKIRDVALPVIGGIAGTLVGGPAGAAIGSSLGQTLVGVGNRAAASKFAGTDSAAVVDEQLAGSLARGSLGQSLGNLAGGVMGAGLKSGDSLSTMFTKLTPTLNQNLPDVAQGIGTAVAAGGLTPMPKQKGVRYFRTGGEASPGFADKFRTERAVQGPGGSFMYQGKRYNTYFKEEVDDNGRPLASVARSMPGFQPGEVPSINSSSVSGLRKKSGVSLNGVNAVLTSYLNQLPDELRNQVLVTSGTDSFGVHSKKSRHRTGDALDLRFKPSLYAYIQSDPVAAQMGLNVLDPNHGTAPHIHLQYTGGQHFRTGGETGSTPRRPLALPPASVAAASTTAVERPYNRMQIARTLPAVTVSAPRNNNPLEAAGARIGHEYVQKLKADPRYAKSPWSVGSPTDIVDPLISYPGQVLDQATRTANNAVLKPSTVIDATSIGEAKLPAVAGGLAMAAVRTAGKDGVKSAIRQNLDVYKYARNNFSASNPIRVWDLPSRNKVDEKVRGIVKEQNTFKRGVYLAPSNDKTMLTEGRFGISNKEFSDTYGMDPTTMTREQIAEHFAKTIPKNPKGGTASGSGLLYTSNSGETAKAYTYGQGYEVDLTRDTKHLAKLPSLDKLKATREGVYMGDKRDFFRANADKPEMKDIGRYYKTVDKNQIRLEQIKANAYERLMASQKKRNDYAESLPESIRFTDPKALEYNKQADYDYKRFQRFRDFSFRDTPTHPDETKAAVDKLIPNTFEHDVDKKGTNYAHRTLRNTEGLTATKITPVFDNIRRSTAHKGEWTGGFMPVRNDSKSVLQHVVSDLNPISYIPRNQRNNTALSAAGIGTISAAGGYIAGYPNGIKGIVNDTKAHIEERQRFAQKRVAERQAERKRTGSMFRAGGSTEPFTYKYGGMTFTVDKPTDYKVHDDDSLEEDLVMFNNDGSYYGRMRLGERIFDQKSNLGMKAIMNSSVSPEQKRIALGELVHDELLTHRTQDGSHEFRLGGVSSPGRGVYPGGGGATTMTTPGVAVAKVKAASKAKAESDLRAEFERLGYSLAREKNPAARARLHASMSRVQEQLGYDSTTDFGPAGPRPLTTPITKPAARTAPVTTSTSKSTTRGSVTTTSKTRRPALAAPVAATTTAAVKPTATTAAVQSFAKNYKPAAIDTVGNLPLVPGGTGMSTKPVINQTAVAAVGGKTPVPETSWKPTVSQPAPVADTSSLTGNLMDIGRVALGAAIGSKKTPIWQVPASFQQLQGELATKKNQGYTGQEWSTINGQIADNYQAGQTALTNSLGGGASAGAILSGLTRLGQQRGQQTQAAVTGDIATRRANFGQYAAGVGQELNLSRQLFGDEAGRVASAQAAGAALAQSGLQNIAQRQVFNENYGPGSTYQRLNDAQIDREKEAAETLRKMRLSASGRPALLN